MAAFEKLMLDLSQQLHLHQVISGNDDSEMERLGAFDICYLEAINQLGKPTIGTVSHLLNQSTPNTNYHVKKLISLGLIDRVMDKKDRRVAHLFVTDKYRSMMRAGGDDFWKNLQEDLGEKVSSDDIVTFQRVLKETIALLRKSGLDKKVEENKNKKRKE